MKTRTFRSFISMFFLIFVYFNTASASGNGKTAVVPRVSTGYMDYELKIPGAPPVFPSQNFSVSTYFIGTGTTIFKQGFYFDAYAQTTDKADDNSEAPGIGYYETFDGRRNDYSFSVGYTVTTRSALYFGYKNGRTGTSGNLGGTSVFRENGFFIGGTYGWQIAKKGVLSLNLALADLDGDIKFNTPALPGLALNSVSETTGISYGIAWQSRLNDNYNYSVSLDRHAYEFKNMIDRASGALSGQIDEDMLSLKLSISREM